jgi:hypothetical protein
METREQIVAKLMDESEKLQYDQNDSQRIFETSEKVTQSFVLLLNKIADFRDEIEAKVDEDSARRMADIRMNLVEAYADTLVQLHKLGAMFRISGEAFDRMVEFHDNPEGKPLVMAGL